MNLFVLATVRNPELLPYATLVFRTIRTGFPTADITVFGNALGRDDYRQILEACEHARCQFYDHAPTTHAQWIEELIVGADQPFWLCDTDIIFYSKVEDWQFDTALAGYLIPEFKDEFSRCITRSRLHPSLLHVKPVELRAAIANYEAQAISSVFTPKINLIHPIVLPFNRESYFYDSVSFLYHAVGGTPFTAQQKDAYHHFHCGTIADLAMPAMKYGEQMAKARAQILANPEQGRGMWRAQELYFQAQQFEKNGTNVIAPIVPKDAQEAVAWNTELCLGRADAMAFCNLWYIYCHGIDDLIDTLQDGRPRMAKEQMISLFFNAAVLYNSPFFVANRELLFPIVLQITDAYQNSVAWEHSPKWHLRQMADVWRTCGNTMFTMIALICGGEAHMRRMSMAINERDYLLQHDDAGNPI